MSQTRVLILVENESVPSDRHVWNQSPALARAGFDVTVICPRGVDRDREPYASAAMGCHPSLRTPTRRRRLFGYGLEYASAIWHIGRLALEIVQRAPLRRRPRVQPAGPPSPRGLPLKRQGARFIFDHHDLTPELFARASVPVGGCCTASLSPPSSSRFASPTSSWRKTTRTGRRSYARPAAARRRRRSCAPGRICGASRPPNRTLSEARKPHLLSYVGAMAPTGRRRPSTRCAGGAAEKRQDWHAIFMGDGESLPELRRLASELGPRPRPWNSPGGWTTPPSAACSRAPTSASLRTEEPAQRSQLDGEDLRVHGHVPADRVLRPARVARRRCGSGRVRKGKRHRRLRAEDLRPARRSRQPRGDGSGRSKRAEGVLAWEHQERALLAAYDRALEVDHGWATQTALRRPDSRADDQSATSRRLPSSQRGGPFREGRPGGGGTDVPTQRSGGDRRLLDGRHGRAC